MAYEVEIEAFCFDAKLDYLPYYIKQTHPTGSLETVGSLLEAIRQKDERFDFDKPYCKINTKVVHFDTPMQEIYKAFGYSLRIDPLSEYRSKKSLVIDDSDFWQNYEIIAPFCDKEDRAYYESLYGNYYASESFSIAPEYIGDAALIVAHRLIVEKKHPQKEEILDTIASHPYGLFACEFDNNCFDGEDYTEQIEALKAMVRPAPSPLKQKLQKLFANKNLKCEKIDLDRLGTEPVAYYYGYANVDKELMQAIPSLVRYTYESKKCGMSLLQDSKALAYKKAGRMLLDAFDSGAGILIVEDEKACDFLVRNKSAIGHALGRDMLIEIIHAKEAKSHLFGNKSEAA